jgi:tetratricopeptide (TPR) repeat protein
MKGDIEFIDREEETTKIDNLIAERGTLKVICVQGEGGIGKTRLLEHVLEQYTTKRQRDLKLLFTHRIDFDNPELNISETLGRRIAQELGEKNFRSYIDSLLDWRKMGIAGVRQTRLTEEGEKVDRQFLECINKVAASRRIVLLFDTVDQLLSSDTGLYHLRLATRLSNAVIIMAGRESGKIGQALSKHIGTGDIDIINLSPLEDLASEEYIRARQSRLGLSLDSKLQEKIQVLARGKPLYIDLIIEWIARDIPMPWLLEKSLDELDLLSEIDREDLEKALVKPIGELRTDTDRLLWIMALIYPIHQEIVLRLLSWSSTRLNIAWENVKTLSFVKELPDGSLKLHDLVREMMHKYLRPEIEVDREQQWFSETSQYLRDVREQLKKQVEELDKEEGLARERKHDLEAWDLFVKREAAERALWIIDGQYLGYQLLSDPVKGLEEFEESFVNATKGYQLSYRSVLISQVQRFRDRLSLTSEQEFQIDFRRAQYFIDNAMYDQAEALINQLLKEYEEHEDHRRINLYIQLGNVVVRLGRFDEGYLCFQQATKLSQNYGREDLLVQTLNGWGWVCRLMGNLEEAESYYRDAYKLSLKLGDEWRQGWIMNNLGFVNALQRKRDTAFRLCNMALEVWKKNSFSRGIGAVYSTLGEISTEFNQFDDALAYLDNALEIFEPEADKDWLSTVYWERGKVLWLKHNHDEALSYLEKANALGVKRDEPVVLHYLAEVYLSKGDQQKAQDFFWQSYRTSLEAPDPFFELNSLGDLIKLAALSHDKKLLQQRDEFVKNYSQFRGKYIGVRYNLPEGLLLRYLGDIYLLTNDVENAIRQYKIGLPLIAEHGSYEPYNIVGQLTEIENRVFNRIPEHLIRELGHTLVNFWESSGHDISYPEALGIYYKWQNWGHIIPDHKKEQQ